MELKSAYQTDMPMGLGMALMQNKPAMEYFSSLPDQAKQRIIDHTHSIQSKEEMQAYVDSLAPGEAGRAPAR